VPTTTESPLERLRRLEAEERAAADPAGTGPARRRRGGVWATVGGAIVLVLAKGKVLLGALKFGALFKTFSTLALSAAVYARFYGAELAIGLVLLILVHEYGHGIAAKIMGLKVGAPIFIPFFGAAIALKEQPKTTWIEAVVGFGGPFAGMIGGAGVLAAGLNTQDPHWRGLLVTLAWSTFMLNLFNLMPALGLDGDRISQPFRPWFWIPACLVTLALVVVSAETTGHPNPILLLMLVVGGVKGGRAAVLERRKREGASKQSLLERVTERERYVEESTVLPWQRAASAFAYVGLVLVLSLFLVLSQQLLPDVTG
jgi:Zn-dependent protease